MDKCNLTRSEADPISSKDKSAYEEDFFTILDNLSLGVEQCIDPRSVYRKTIIKMTQDIAQKMGVSTQTSVAWAKKRSRPEIYKVMGCEFADAGLTDRERGR